MRQPAAARWVRPRARAFLEVSDHADTAEAIEVLDRELNAPRRFAGGAAAVVLLLLAGLTATLAIDLVATDGAAVTAAGLGVLALALAGAAAWAGLGVITAGNRVVGAYRDWTGADAGAGTHPAGLIERTLAGPWLTREALAAATLLGTVFAAVLVILPLTGTIEDSATVGIVIGGTALIGFGTATWCLLATDFRAGWAHSRRIARGHQRTRGR